MTLCAILDSDNNLDVEGALDILVQRVRAIQSAKSTTGNWEKTSRLELIEEPGSSAITEGLFRLTT